MDAMRKAVTELQVKITKELAIVVAINKGSML